MKKFIFFIFLFSLSLYSYAFEKSPQSQIKIKKLEKIVRVPTDVPFFDGDNNKYYFEEFEGKTIVLAFWATWCAPCIKELPELDILKKDFRKLPVEIIAISEDFQGSPIIREFYKDNEIRNLRIYHDYGNALFRALNVAGLPSTFIIDPDGVVTTLLEGAVTWNDDLIRQILLENIPNNPVMPKNTSKDVSLNQKVKTPIKNESHDKEEEEVKIEEKKEKNNETPKKDSSDEKK
jgi:thiol-disulfide isomerase/thioredoxin